MYLSKNDFESVKARHQSGEPYTVIASDLRDKGYMSNTGIPLSHEALSRLMIAKVNFNRYDFHHKYDKKTREKLAAILDDAGIDHALDWNYRDDKEAEEVEEKFFAQDFFLPIDKLINAGLAFRVKETDEKERGVFKQITTLSDRALSLVDKTAPVTFVPPNSVVNNFNVYAHESFFVKINEVDVETDCCTDQLRNRLSEGWHIMAVCPQPKQRRPDYVLGRIRKESDEKLLTTSQEMAEGMPF